MDRLTSRLMLVGLLGIATSMAPGQGTRAAGSEEGDAVDKKREALWQALEKALPEKYREIDVHAENPSLTQVLFRSQGMTLTFSLKTGKVEEVPHMKALAKINRITFEESQGGGDFALWHNGRRELTVAAER
jgi:hypothetical protein